MTSDDRALKDLIGRRSPSNLEFVAARDRVLHELRATPAERLTARLGVTAPPAPRWRTGLSLAAAAAIILALVTTPWTGDDSAADTVRAGDAGRMLTLDDGSRVEMRAQSELSIERADDGIGIRLLAGDIIINAAKQRDGHLYVHTKEMTVAVVGTVFLVKAGADGSRVAVIEGEVRVREGDTETRLRPGEQVASSPTMARRPITEEIRWSRNVDAHLAILDSFTKGFAQTAGTLASVAAQAPAAARPAAATEFEEASIRECDPDNLPPPPAGARGGGANSFYMTPGRTYALCMTPAVMVRLAYRFRALPEGSLTSDTRRATGWRLDQVSGQGADAGIAVRGGPEWARNDRYTVEAVAGYEADGDTMSGPMLRALLERRFKLKAHVETEEVPSWTMTVAAGGVKMKPVAPGGCDEPQPGVPGQPTRFRTLEEVRSEARPTCGLSPGQSPDGGSAVWVAGVGTVEDIAGALRRHLNGASVVDKTGVTGRFNFLLQYDPDPQAIVSALQDQLGLRLEPTRAVREYLVIDSIERPSAN